MTVRIVPTSRLTSIGISAPGEDVAAVRVYALQMF
jgi:hypothetical protein